MDLLVSTSLSETWVVGSGGCATCTLAVVISTQTGVAYLFPIRQHVLTVSVVEQLCPKHRGGTLDIAASSTWESLGEFQLSFPYTDVKANGNYGFDTLVVRESQSEDRVSLEKTLITAFDTTEYYNGFFGLGIVSGDFNGRVSVSPFSQMVAEYGWFPSYTYGYTAGAYYSMTALIASLASNCTWGANPFVQRGPERHPR